MIPQINGEKTTPKSMAREIIARELEGAFYWTEHMYAEEATKMTERERQLVSDQIEKLVARIRKIILA